MADINVPLQALTAFAAQTTADLAAAKAATAAATEALAAAVKAEADAAAQALTARLTLDAMNGVAAIETAVARAEKDPATRYYLAGAAVVALGTVAVIVAKLLGHL